MRIGIAAVTALTGLFFASGSQADDYRSLLLFSCMPDIGLMTIATTGIYRSEAVPASSAHAWEGDLEHVPFDCSLQKEVKIGVRAWCRSQLTPDEIGCGPGREGGRAQRFAVYVNDEILPLNDPPRSNADDEHWLRTDDVGGFQHWVEISAFRKFNGSGQPDGFKVNAQHCRLRTGRDAPRYRPRTLGPVETECESVEKSLPQK